MKLPLAIDIAATVVDAQVNKSEVDVAAQANELVASHPEAETTVEEVAATLEEELARGEAG